MSSSLSPRRNPAPRDFARLALNGGRILLQTKVTSFRCPDPDAQVASIDLYTVVHFGESNYYAGINAALRSTLYDCVYHELITSRANLRIDPCSSLVYLDQSVAPTLPASAQARSLGLIPQLDALDLHNGCIADLTVEEIRDVVTDTASSAETEAFEQADVPFAVLALVSRAAAHLIRVICVFLPCPELNIFLFDAIDPDSLTSPPAPLSLLALFRGDFLRAKRLLFGQLVQRETAARANVRLDDDVTGARNQRVMKSIRTGAKEGYRDIAVVVGAFHGDQLGRMFENSLGMEYSRSSWRTALDCGKSCSWTSFWICPDSVKLPALSFAGIFVSVLGIELLALIDWCRTLQSLAGAIEGRDDPDAGSGIMLVGSLYLLRHAGVYVFLKRWLRQQVETATSK
jgi:hypothetical protein